MQPLRLEQSKAQLSFTEHSTTIAKLVTELEALNRQRDPIVAKLGHLVYEWCQLYPHDCDQSFLIELNGSKYAITISEPPDSYPQSLIPQWYLNDAVSLIPLIDLSERTND